MAKKWDNDKPKIQMLLDIENIFGESTRGLGKFVMTLLVALIPPLIIGYGAIYMWVPWQILVVLCVVWAARSAMIILGDEKARVRNFKRVRDDAFAATKDMVRIRTIHPNGCVEYTTGNVAFFIVTYNDSSKEAVGKSRQIDRFINLAVGRQPFDIFVQNITETDQLDSRYGNVTLFSDAEAAEAFMEIIDFNRAAVADSSTLTRNIICVKGAKYQWKQILLGIESALESEAARVFRTAYLVTEEEEIENIISRDVDGNVDLTEMMQKKYYTGQTFGSKVISYDYKDKRRAEEKRRQEEPTTFIPTYKVGR